jgi:hypothetical protein
MKLLKAPLISYRPKHMLHQKKDPIDPIVHRLLDMSFLGRFRSCFGIYQQRHGPGSGGLGVEIHKDTIVVGDCRIYQQVTIGGNHSIENVPSIAANALVLQDITSGATAERIPDGIVPVKRGAVSGKVS